MSETFEVLVSCAGTDYSLRPGQIVSVGELVSDEQVRDLLRAGFIRPTVMVENADAQPAQRATKPIVDNTSSAEKKPRAVAETTTKGKGRK